MTRAVASDAWVALTGLVLLAVWEAAGFDRTLSRAYGDAAGFVWRDAWFTSRLLHGGGRLVAAGLLVALAADCWCPLLAGPPRRERAQSLLVTAAAMLLVPALKRTSRTSCPWSLAEFGGTAPYVPHWLPGVADGGPGHCFPSGHATSAFAFLGVYFIWRQRRPGLALAWLAGVGVLGALGGWVQMARGAHFASHTLWSAWLCWVFCAAAARCCRLVPPAARTAAARHRRAADAPLQLPFR